MHGVIAWPGKEKRILKVKCAHLEMKPDIIESHWYHKVICVNPQPTNYLKQNTCCTSGKPSSNLNFYATEDFMQLKNKSFCIHGNNCVAILCNNCTNKTLSRHFYTNCTRVPAFSLANCNGGGWFPATVHKWMSFFFSPLCTTITQDIFLRLHLPCGCSTSQILFCYEQHS